MNKRLLITILLIFLFIGFTFPLSCLGEEKNKEFNPDNESGFFYTIKKGDTLWDLSQKFYNSNWDWPGLWEMNDEIKNPHWIYPGRKIEIFLKDHLKARKKDKPVNNKEPIVITPTFEAQFSYPPMDGVGFIIKKAIEPIGKILKNEFDNNMITERDVIFIKSEGSHKFLPGEFYHIFHTETVKNKDAGFTGVKHLIKGKIEVIEDRGTYATALVLKSYRDAAAGDSIMPFYERAQIVTVNDNPSPIDAVMLCSENNRILINDYVIGFISKGKNDNIKPGQIYSVFVENKITDYSVFRKKEDSAIELAPFDSARIIVLHTEDISSTVMVLSSNRAIMEGYKVH